MIEEEFTVKYCIVKHLLEIANLLLFKIKTSLDNSYFWKYFDKEGNFSKFDFSIDF